MKTEFNPNVLNRIKYENNIKTDGALAEALGVERSTMLRWQKGEGAPSFRVIALIATKYKIPIQDMALEPEQAAA